MARGCSTGSATQQLKTGSGPPGGGPGDPGGCAPGERRVPPGTGGRAGGCAILRGAYHLYQGRPGVGNLLMGLVFGRCT